MCAQTKILVTTNGEKITIDPNAGGDNLGNHTATTTLNLDTHDISSAATAFIKKDTQFFDTNTANSNTFTVNKNNGTFGIYNSNAAVNALSINETTSKTTVVSAQIKQGADSPASTPDNSYVAVAGDTNGNIAWKPLYKVKGATTLMNYIYSIDFTKINTSTFTPIGNFSMRVTAPATGVLNLKTVLVNFIQTAFTTPTSIKTEMVITVNGVPIPTSYGVSFITTGATSTYAKKGNYHPTSTNIYCQYPVIEGQSYIFSVMARVADYTDSAALPFNYIGTCPPSNTTTDRAYNSTMEATLVTN
ncbi:hypothetical protein AAFH68_05550 [Flavobacterium sp. CGRL1]